MKIFLDRVQIKNYKLYKSKKGRVLNRLHGINITGNDIQVEPVYLPLMSIEKEGGIILIEISLGKPLLLVVLYQRFPYIHFERINAIKLEDE
jgi:hypothetical protein